MTWQGWLQIALYILRPIERIFYAAAGVRDREEQNWKAYALAMLAFNAAGFVLLYATLRLQNVLPLNPRAHARLARGATRNHFSERSAAARKGALLRAADDAHSLTQRSTLRSHAALLQCFRRMQSMAQLPTLLLHSVAATVIGFTPNVISLGLPPRRRAT